MQKVFKALWRRITCRHKEYEFLADLNMRHVETNRRLHDVTIACCNCGKRKSFQYFRENNM